MLEQPESSLLSDESTENVDVTVEPTTDKPKEDVKPDEEARLDEEGKLEVESRPVRGGRPASVMSITSVASGAEKVRVNQSVISVGAERYYLRGYQGEEDDELGKLLHLCQQVEPENFSAHVKR